MNAKLFANFANKLNACKNELSLLFYRVLETTPTGRRGVYLAADDENYSSISSSVVKL
jgi:hypothetical protein